MNLPHIATASGDGRDPTFLESIGAATQSFDLVAVDAPCSGLGTLRRHPELRYRAKSSVDELVEIQCALLESAASRVKAGGSLLYTVCTITEKEIAEPIDYLMNRFDDFNIEDNTSNCPIEPDKRKSPAGHHYEQLWTDQHGCDSFSAVLFKRRK